MIGMHVDCHGVPTDDADRWAGGDADTFASDPAPDWDGVGYDDWHRVPKCGVCYLDGDGVTIPGHPGCRHCSPPEHELKPDGFGIERHEDPARDRAVRAMWDAVGRRAEGKYTSAWAETWGLSAGRFRGGPRATDADREHCEFLWRCWSRWSARRARHSDRVWDRLCDECETHAEACGRYAAWAARAVTVRYRDDHAPKFS